MIIFDKIKFKNFLSYGNNQVNLHLNRGSNTLIVGKNGSGKSSIITDTLVFALYGKPYRKINKSSLVNSINKKNCLVEISFNKGNDRYIVKRGISPNIFEIYKNGDILNQNSSSVDYQKVLEDEILQMNYNTFVQTIIIGKKYIPFMQLNTSDRRELIEELFDINYFTNMSTNIKIKSKLNKELIIDLKYKIENNTNLLNNENENLNILNQQNEQLIEKYNNDIKISENKIKENTKKIDDIKKQYNDLKPKITNIDKFNESINKLNIYENQINNTIKNLNEQNNFYNKSDVCSVCKQKIDINFKNKILNENKLNIDTNNENLKKIIDKKKDINENLSKIIKSNNDINESLNNLNNTYNKLLNENENLSNYILKIRSDLEKLNERDNIIQTKKQHIEQILAQSKQYKEQLEHANEQQKYYDIILNILKDDGLKTYLVKTFLPLINDTISKYMDIFNFNCSFTLDEQFNEVIKSRFRDKFTYYNFSEGEKLRIDFALLFVFREIAKSRNSVNTNILILDEVLDGSLDEDGINGFLTILKTLESDKDVFIISHHSEKYYDIFPNIIEIDKKTNYSEIKIDTFSDNYGGNDNEIS